MRLRYNQPRYRKWQRVEGRVEEGGRGGWQQEGVLEHPGPEQLLPTVCSVQMCGAAVAGPSYRHRCGRAKVWGPEHRPVRAGSRAGAVKGPFTPSPPDICCDNALDSPGTQEWKHECGCCARQQLVAISRV